MKNDQLTQLWESQKEKPNTDNPRQIIRKAKKQRGQQRITILVLSITIMILIGYAITFALGNWNNFSIGLLLMIGSLSFRLTLEFITIHRKEERLISLDNRSFQAYLRKYYRARININYIITPLSFATYVYGFTLLLPYFKIEFTPSFYTFLLISGFGSLAVVGLIIINSTLKEQRFLKELNRQ